jgi:hypothetical protein
VFVCVFFVATTPDRSYPVCVHKKVKGSHVIPVLQDHTTNIEPSAGTLRKVLEEIEHLILSLESETLSHKMKTTFI